jgi:PTS system nitrogen regulatory IIA component
MQLTVREASRLLNVPERAMYRWIQEGSIPAQRIGEHYRFNPVELAEWATARRLRVSPCMFDGKEQHGPLPSLALALQAGGVHSDVGGDDRDSALRAVIALLQVPDEADREFLQSVFMARNHVGGSVVGEGIAVPGVRNPIVLKVNRPMASLFYLRQPVRLSTEPGGALVHTLFAWICPTVRVHLQLLTRLTWMLGDGQLAQVLVRRGSREQVLEVIRLLEARTALVGSATPPGREQG